MNKTRFCQKWLYIILLVIITCNLLACSVFKLKSNYKANELFEQKVFPGKLASNYPKAKVPLVSGEIISSSVSIFKFKKESPPSYTWTVTLNTKVRNPVTVVKKMLYKQGFTQLGRLEPKLNASSAVVRFYNTKYVVLVKFIATPDQERKMVYYTVTEIALMRAS